MSKEEKKELTAGEAQAKLIGDTVKQVLDQTLPTVMAAGINAAQNAANQARMPVVAVSRERCGECGQPNMACGKKHRQMIVYPQNRAWAKSFDGLRLNGVRYMSSGPSRLITVPADAAFERQLQEWERQELEMRTGKTFEHNTGSFGPNGAQINQPVGPPTTTT